MSLNLLNNKTHRLRIRRGTRANLTYEYPLEGELYYITDEKRLYVGDASYGLVGVSLNTAITYENDVLCYEGEVVYA